MIMIKKISRLCFLACFVFGLSACQAFFSTSIAPWAARAAFKIPADVSTEQALDYVTQALMNNDPVLAAALTPVLFAQAEAARADPVLYNQLANAMVSTVLLSTNVGTAFNKTLVVLAGGIEESEEGLAATVEAILDAFSSVNFTTADLAALQLIVDQPPSSVSAIDLQAAAAALTYQALSETGLLGGDTTTVPDLSELAENDSFKLAVNLLALIPEGTESPFGNFTDMFGNLGI
jgi:hypothetical protein